MVHHPFPISFEHLVAITDADRDGSDYTSSKRENTPKWEEGAANLIEQAIHAEVVDFQAAVSPNGHGALVSWERGFKAGLPSRLLHLACVRASSLGPTVNGLPAVAQVLDYLFTDSKYGYSYKENILGRAVNWLKAVPEAELFYLDKPNQPKGSGLLGWFAHKGSNQLYRLSQNEWDELIEVMEGRGAQWLQAPASALASPRLPPNLLQALCCRGLNLLGEENSVPLWSALLDLKQPALTALVSSSLDAQAQGSPSGDMVRFEAAKEEYFAQFIEFKKKREGVRRRVAGQAEKDRKELLAHLTSRPDWSELADKSGRSALFHAVLANPGIIREALAQATSSSSPDEDRLAWKKALTHTDAQGRNVWFYVLPNSSDATWTDSLVDALRVFVPSSKDTQGNGWAVQLLLEGKGALRTLALPGEKLASALPTPDAKQDALLGEMFPMDWDDSSPETKKKALANACVWMVFARHVINSLPVDSLTLPVKALTQLVLSPDGCVEKGGYYRERFEKMMSQLSNSDRWVLDVHESSLRKMKDWMNQRLKKKPQAVRDAAHDHFSKLEQLALQSRLSSQLPEPTRGRRMGRF